MVLYLKNGREQIIAIYISALKATPVFFCKMVSLLRTINLSRENYHQMIF